ncbi:MAG TPA: ABC transporter permease [Streptosporangiaceae bacterium]|jgi:ABC-2 type transport system permease protein|nr:ABC transporter permease [Streptosporangiaceae bacterium]
MTAATLGQGIAGQPPRAGVAGFGRLLHAEWTKIRTVRSTFWSLVILVITAIGLNTLVVSLAIANWDTTSAATKQTYLADPTGFLRPALLYAQIPLCVLGVLVITSEYSTGMIRSSILAVPRRVPMLAAKATVFAAVAFVVSEVLGFVSFIIAEPIIGHRLPESLRDPATFRAVFGVGLYLAVLGLFSFAVGALVRHTAAAITVVIGFLVVFASLARLIPGSAGAHISAYLPANAGLLITHAHQEAADLLSPWLGFGVLCLWTAILVAVACFLLRRRDV